MLKSKQVPLEFQTKVKKYKKNHKIKYKTSLSSVSIIERGNFFCITKPAALTVKQYTSVLKIIKPGMKETSRKARVRLYIKLDTILTKKPKDIRMGRGKGVPTERVASIKNGNKIFKLRAAKNANILYGKIKPKFATKSRIINTKW